MYPTVAPVGHCDILLDFGLFHIFRFVFNIHDEKTKFVFQVGLFRQFTPKIKVHFFKQIFVQTYKSK